MTLKQLYHLLFYCGPKYYIESSVDVRLSGSNTIRCYTVYKRRYLWLDKRLMTFDSFEKANKLKRNLEILRENNVRYK